MLPRPLNDLHPCPPALHGSLVALPTPFRDASLDLATLSRLSERQVRHGTTGLVVCGSTGEGSALSPSERARALAAVVEAAAGRAGVVAGCGASSTEEAVELAVLVARSGATAMLCSPPAHCKPTQDGIVAHIRAVAHAAELPVVLYDVPSRTGVAIADATVARLFERGLITGIKDATGDLSRPPRLRALCGGGLVQLSGDDATSAAHRAMGGHGCVSVTANLAPALCARLHAAWDTGDLDAFARVRDLLAPLHDALFLESNPIPLKAALSILRLCTGDLRLPLVRASAPTQDRLAELLARVGVIEEAEVATRPARLTLVR